MAMATPSRMQASPTELAGPRPVRGGNAAWTHVGDRLLKSEDKPRDESLGG